MTCQASMIFNEAAKGPTALPPHGLSFIVRTDARHATGFFKASLYDHLLASSHHTPPSRADLNRDIHAAYEAWGHAVLNAAARDLDYAQYGLHEEQDRRLQVHFYNAASLAHRAIAAGTDYAARHEDAEDAAPVMFITLDDMIVRPDWVDERNWGEFAISRLFDLNGSGAHLGYTARPGSAPLPAQLATLCDKIDALHAQSGKKPEIVLLEDNVRNVDMINRIVAMLDAGGVFDRASLSCIATCFCCTPLDKRDQIRHGSQTIPLAIVIDYQDAKVDVVTPRDLLFDGLAVTTEGATGRLPSQYLDLSRAFKIQAGNETRFVESVTQASRDFCEAVENRYRVTVPMAWFTAARALSAKTGIDPQTRMIDFLR